jgi:hypothetical protein
MDVEKPHRLVFFLGCALAVMGIVGILLAYEMSERPSSTQTPAPIAPGPVR